VESSLLPDVDGTGTADGRSQEKSLRKGGRTVFGMDEDTAFFPLIEAVEWHFACLLMAFCLLWDCNPGSPVE
jgi:hypothetical protein